MLLTYNCILLKMSTWYSKHVEENIWRINNIKCITLVFLVWSSFVQSPQLWFNCRSSHIPLHKSDLLVCFSLEAGVLLLKLLLIQYITTRWQPICYVFGFRNKSQMRPLQSILAISVMSDYVTEQDPNFNVTSMLVNELLLLQDWFELRFFKM